ncbi:uncharacterized protein [Rutidosis leptorrhynchoides]|uniref:uncharacterized protein n=1 Tax=Rutidosis leptorrhynchoides TaxID=125765 RepID=UPI003A994DE6
MVQYSTKQAWLDLRVNGPVTSWHHIVWYSQLIPKHAFILWLAIWDRLPTQVRLQKWSLKKDSKCLLCDQEADSINYLFFECFYSAKVWVLMKDNLILKGLPNKLTGIIEMMPKFPGKNQIWGIVTRLVLAESVYYIWQERNQRLFRGKKREVEELVDIAKEYIRVKLLTLKVKKSDAVTSVERIWNVQWSRKEH